MYEVTVIKLHGI